VNQLDFTKRHRLGTFGFLVYGNDTGLNGNYGIGDMVTALEWVQQNIASFGGDPRHVTVFGQSAGAEGIRALLQSPPAAGLFTAAIMESDPKPPTYTHYLTRDEEVALQTIPILTLSGCASGDVDAEVTCLRNYDAGSFFNLSTIPANNPVVDGHYVLSPGISFNGTGHVNKVPLLMGHMRDEGASDLSKWLQTENLTQSLASNALPISPAANPSIFPVSEMDNVTTAIWNVTVQVLTESTFSCLDQATAYAIANTTTFPELYYYQFNRSYQVTTYPTAFPNKQLCNAPITPSHPYGDPNGEYYKCHSGELTTVFGTWRRLGLPERDGNDTPFTQAVVDRWSSFGRTYNPNPDPAYLVSRGYTNTTSEIATSGAWYPVTADSQTLRQLQWPSRQDSFTAKERCTVLGLPLDYFL
jgi:carboxylesterase type B